MPVLPDPKNNFINALSDFWTVFFRDTTQLESYYKGVEINLGQRFLELLDGVLGTSLKDLPVFNKEYYKLVTITEDLFFFKEGKTIAEDSFTFTPNFALIDLVFLMNKVINPTYVLENKFDFTIKDGTLFFNKNVFDTPKIPVRNITKLYPAQYMDLLDFDWISNGVFIGDIYSLEILGSGKFQTIINNIKNNKLLFNELLQEFKQDISKKSFRINILRDPFDKQKINIPLQQHPLVSTRMSTQTTDGTLIATTSTIDFSAEPYYKGVFTPLTNYIEGDLTEFGGQLYRAKFTHTSNLIFLASNWTALTQSYLFIHHPTETQNDGLFLVLSSTATTVTLARPTTFLTSTSMRAEIIFVDYGVTSGVQPIIALTNSQLISNTVEINARRIHDIYKNNIVYPANQNVIEGVDYLVDYNNGALIILSAWNAGIPARINYQWRLLITTTNYTYRGSFTPSVIPPYVPGDTIVFNNKVYVCKVGNNDLVFDPSKFSLFVNPFAFDISHPTRQIALWGTDVLLDQDTLYNNFGYLLSFRRPSSEQYRAFLRGVAQLFVLGPTIERFESALNVMANFPVIRDDGEVLKNFDNGIAFSNNDGKLIDTNEGRDGTTNFALSQFSSPTANFFPSDVGAEVRIQNGLGYLSYTVTAVLSSTTATINPPPQDGINRFWNYTHITLVNRFQNSGSYLFSEADLNGFIIISNASFSRNNGIFKIVGIENPTSVILDNNFDFNDEINLSWQVSRTGVQVVTTSRDDYVFPLLVPIKTEIANINNFNILTFQAFDALTSAFQVVDYLVDPTWWHNTAIPKEVLTLVNEAAGRRRVSPLMIEHKVNPIDGAVVGDAGIAVGVNDENKPGILREGSAVWFGGNTLQLTFPVNTPLANPNDVSTYVVITFGSFTAQFQILNVNTAGDILTLKNFPPPELNTFVPPIVVGAKLSPLLFRRTVAFIMMDRYLKYHALKVRISENTPLPIDFINEATLLLQQAKPAHTYIYFDSFTDFKDVAIINEILTFDLEVGLEQKILALNNQIVVGPPTLLQVGDTFIYQDETQVIPAAPGVYALTPTLPILGSPRFYVMKAWFDSSVLIGGRRPAESFEYTIDPINGTVEILTAFPGPSTLYYVVVIMRTRAPLDILDPGETRIVVAGTDPTKYKGLTQTKDESGIIDRAVQLEVV